jgi:hypothetical protein
LFNTVIIIFLIIPHLRVKYYFCTETKESLLHLFWECTYTKKCWFSLVNVFENCGLNMQYMNAPNIYWILLHIIIKIVHLNWLNTLHVTFTIPRYRLEFWYRPVQKPCIDWYYWSIHGYLFVYVLINYNVTYNLILFLIIGWTPFKQLL